MPHLPAVERLLPRVLRLVLHAPADELPSPRFQLVVPATMRSPDSAALELRHGSRRVQHHADMRLARGAREDEPIVRGRHEGF